jgi:hypothetical protein
MEIITKEKDTSKPSILICFEDAEMQTINNFKKMPNGHLSFQACLQTVDDINRNSKSYPQGVLMEALTQPRIQDLLRRNAWFGELSHPYQRKDFQRSVDILPACVSHRICTMPVLKGNQIMAEVHTVEPCGGTADSWIETEHCQLGFSMRGITPYEVDKSTPVRHKVVKAPMSVITYDIVFFPSHASALAQVAAESADAECYNQPETKEYMFEDIAQFISQESKNFKILKEELGIDINGLKPIVRNEAKSVDIALTDGRLARLSVENDVMAQIASYI